MALVSRAGVHVQAGEFDAATELVDEADRISAATGYSQLRYQTLTLAAWRGAQSEATPDPVIPDDKRQDIDSLLAAEVGVQAMGAQNNVIDMQTGQPVVPPTEEE